MLHYLKNKGSLVVTQKRYSSFFKITYSTFQMGFFYIAVNELMKLNELMKCVNETLLNEQSTDLKFNHCF